MNLQREDGKAEAAPQIKEALLHIKYMERGLSWKAARDTARVDMEQLARAQEMIDLARRHARMQAAHER